MIKTLYYSLKIDIYYAINSLLFYLRKLPIFKDLFTDDSYNSKMLKIIFGIIAGLLSLGRFLITKLIYISIIYYIATLFGNNILIFCHLFLIFSLIGMFVNNKVLNISMKKYLSIVIFNMNAKDYLKYILWFNCFTNFLLNISFLYIFGVSIKLSLLLSTLQVFLRIVGEGFNIWYHRNKGDFWYNNKTLYFSILFTLLLLCLSPLISIVVSEKVIIIFLFLFGGLSIFSYLYFNSFNDYKLLVKRINNKNSVLSNNDNNSLSLVNVNKKDENIAYDKLKDKYGYDYFNTIFFERHKSVLLNSSRNYATILLVIYLVCVFFIIRDNSFARMLHSLLSNHISWFVFFMYLINRGSIVSRAMFFNCDHAMLRYSFYRQPDVILGLFKRRLTMLSIINLLPSLVVAFGNVVLLILLNDHNYINIISIFLFILILSVLFSVHHLVVYYLLQPYNIDMKVSNFSYSIVNLITYFIAYNVARLKMTSIVFSVGGLVVCALYIVVSLILIKKYAPFTFKIHE